MARRSWASRSAAVVAKAKWTWGGASREMAQKLQQDRPYLKLTETMDLATPAQESFNNTMHTLYEGALLAVVVVWFFLRNWRATFLAAVALPMSVLPAFMGMHLLDFTLNGVSLLALTLVIGVLVDDAIVEIENIERHLEWARRPTRLPWRLPTRSVWR